MTSGWSSLRQREALLAVLRLADDVDAGIARERGGHPLAHEREVVHQQDVDPHAATSVRGRARAAGR